MLNLAPAEIPLITDLLRSPTTSGWLKHAIDELMQRDPVDAANDAELLHHIMAQHAREALMIAHDNTVSSQGVLEFSEVQR